MITIHSRISPAQVIGDILTNHLRVVESDGELYEAAKGCVRSAIAAAETYTNRVLVNSTVTISFDKIENRVIELPTAPIREITEVRYYGVDGAWHPVEGYTLVSNAQRAMLEFREIPAIDASRLLNVFEISAAVGFEDGAMPDDIVAALKLMSATLLDNPADNVTGTIATELPMNAKMLLTPYRITPYGL